MTFYHEDHLRVQKPVTSNGINPIVGADGRIRYKTTFLPITAKKFLERKNAKLPEHLRMKIEVVPGHRYELPKDTRLEDAEAKIRELEAKLAAKPTKAKTSKTMADETAN